MASDVSALRDDIADAYIALHNSISAPIIHIDNAQAVKIEQNPATKTPGKAYMKAVSEKVA